MKTNELEVEINGNKVTIALTDEQIKQLQVPKKKEWWKERAFKEVFALMGMRYNFDIIDISEDVNINGFSGEYLINNYDQAICASEYIKLFIEMYNFCQLRNGNNKIEWGNGRSKYVLRVYGIHNGSNSIHVERFSTDCVGVFGLAVLTQEHAEEMLSIFGDRIKAVYSKLQNY